MADVSIHLICGCPRDYYGNPRGGEHKFSQRDTSLGGESGLIEESSVYSEVSGDREPDGVLRLVGAGLHLLIVW